MVPNLIPFLTQNDRTVAGALELFLESRNAPAKYWGFKDTGISPESARMLGKAMMDAGKIVCFECLSEDEDDCLQVAKFVAEMKFEYLIGMQYLESVHRVLKRAGTKYFPTCGDRSGIPRMLHGTIDEIIADGKRLQDYGVDGLSLSVYRFTDGDPEELARRFVNEISAPVIVTGSIRNEERLDFIKRLGPWGFTVGSAFFRHDFGKDLSFGAQIESVAGFLAGG